MKLEVEEFSNKLETKYQKPLEVLNAAIQNGNIDEHLAQWLSNRINAGIVQTKIYYPQYFAYVNKKEAELPSDYYAFTKDFDFENEELFYFSDVRRAGESIISHTFDYEEMESISDYYTAQIHAVEKYTANPKLIEYFKYKLISDKINFAGGLDGMGEEIKEFIETLSVPERKNTLQYAVFKWEPLKKGLDAPNFKAYSRDGEEVQLQDLEGKTVYIDVWATWCGPCIAEIPSLEKMESKYHDQNIEFVSVSIDKESDREKWIKFIEDRDLGGMQIMAKNDWNSELTSKYNISGIPRFILVDSNGKIVSADAPRPSNEKGLDILLADILD
jgi:thiol-disulfide isomerase/thioredoxin